MTHFRPKPASMRGKFGKISVGAAAALIREERQRQIAEQRAVMDANRANRAKRARKQTKIKVYDTTARKVEDGK